MTPKDHYDQREALHEARGARPAAPLSSPWFEALDGLRAPLDRIRAAARSSGDEYWADVLDGVSDDFRSAVELNREKQATKP